jgi:hypothetical protein
MPDAGPGLRAPNGCRTSLSGCGEVNIGGLEPANSVEKLSFQRRRHPVFASSM